MKNVIKLNKNLRDLWLMTLPSDNQFKTELFISNDGYYLILEDHTVLRIERVSLSNPTLLVVSTQGLATDICHRHIMAGRYNFMHPITDVPQDMVKEVANG